MSLLSNAMAIPPASTGYNLTDSVRFRSSASAYLERTPTTSGSTTTGTISVWIKHSDANNDNYHYIFEQGNAVTSRIYLLTHVNTSSTIPNRLMWGFTVSGTGYSIVTNKMFRDPSAWYHVVAVLDTSNATAADRLRLYINGERQTSLATDTTSSIPLNQTTQLNSTDIARIGTQCYSISNLYEGYMTEFNFVDGQALTPSDFGEYDATTGVWKPKRYTGTYGTNGFYLPMKATTQASGFNTVTYTGTGTDYTKIKNVGFAPDFVWFKQRSGTEPNILFDTIRGADNGLSSNATTAEVNFATSCIRSFDSDGFTVGTNTRTNTSGATYVGWCWEAGGTASSNTDGTITSNVSANTAKGFSIVKWTHNGTAFDTVGHGLGAKPQIVIQKLTSQTGNWAVFTDIIDGSMDYLYLNTTAAAAGTSNITPTSNYFGQIGGTSGWEVVAYCFSEVSGFSKFGTYTGTGSTGNSITGLGFRPAFLMIKRTDSTGNWIMVDNTRSPDNSPGEYLLADSTNQENVTTIVDFDSDGFTVNATGSGSNASGGTYIYMAFADTRDFQWNFDASGNKNNWTATNINSNASSETSYDIMSDVPTLTDEDTANFAVLNPNDKYSMTVTEGNLRTIGTADYKGIRGTMALPSTGKFYWETYISRDGAANVQDQGIGLCGENINLNSNPHTGTPTVVYYPSGYIYINNSAAQSGITTATIGDIIGVAVNMDDDEITFYKNGSTIGSTQSISSITGYTLLPFWLGTTNRWSIWNFGQRPFAYTPPTGYKKLNTYNLPDSAIVDGSQYFDVDAYSGTTSAQYDTQSRSSLSFSPDLVWIKCRSDGVSHTLVDSVTGTGKYLSSNTTNAQTTDATGYASVYSFDTNGWTMEYNGRTSMTGRTYVGWAWRGSDSSAVSNTDGSLTSTVSANTTSGFSVCTYTGNGGTTSFGHGLGVAPDVVIAKSRDASYAYPQWYVYHRSLGYTYPMFLNLPDDAWLNTTTYWSNNPDSSKVYIGSDPYGPNVSGDDYVAYCFAPVEGFSKFGSYTGNGSTDGPFIYTGFRPAFVLFKSYTQAYNWHIVDSERNTYNLMLNDIVPNSSAADNTTSGILDFVSNGFKLRTSTTGYNDASTYIYMAFAENPFKNSLAR